MTTTNLTCAVLAVAVRVSEASTWRFVELVLRTAMAS